MSELKNIDTTIIGTHSNFNTLITSIGTTKRTLFIGEDQTISGNIVVPKNITIKPVNNAKFIGTGTVTFNSFDGNDVTWKCFNNSISVVFTNQIILRPEWFGALGDGSDDETAFLKVFETIELSSCKMNILLNKIYSIGSLGWHGFLITFHNFRMYGNGWSTGFKLLAKPTHKDVYINLESMFLFGSGTTGVNGLVLKNFSVNLNGIESVGIAARVPTAPIISNIEIFNSPFTVNRYQAFHVSGGSKYLIEKMYIHDVASAYTIGSPDYADGTGTILDSIIRDCKFYNYYSTNGASFADTVMSDCIHDGGANSGSMGGNCAGTEFGARIVPAKNATFRNVTWCNNNGTGGMGFQPVSYYDVKMIKNLTIVDCKAYSNQVAGLYIFGYIDGISIIGGYYYDNGYRGMVISPLLKDGVNYMPKNVKILNTFCYNSNPANRVQDIGIEILGRSAPDNNTSLATDYEIAHNQVYNHNDRGISLEVSDGGGSGYQRFKIHSNNIRDNTNYGIATTTQYTDVIISFNIVLTHTKDIRCSAVSNYAKILFNICDTIDWPDFANYNSATKPMRFGNMTSGARLLGEALLLRLTTILHNQNPVANVFTPDCSYGNVFFINIQSSSALQIANPINTDKNVECQEITFHFYTIFSLGSPVGNITWGNEYYLNETFTAPYPRRNKSITFVSDTNLGWVEKSRTKYDMRGTRYEGYHKYIVDAVTSFTGELQGAIATIPKGAIIESIIANVDTTLTIDAPTTKVGIGEKDYGYSDFGLFTTLTKNSKINCIERTTSPLPDDYELTINGCDNNGDLSSGDITAGKVKTKITYYINHDIDNEWYSDSYVWDPGLIAGSGGTESKIVALTGVEVGDTVLVSTFSVMPATDWTCTATVTNTNEVTAILTNNTAGAVDLGSGTLSITVQKEIPAPKDISVQSSRNAFVLPQKTAAQIALDPLTKGALVYDTTNDVLLYCDGTIWNELAV